MSNIYPFKSLHKVNYEKLYAFKQYPFYYLPLATMENTTLEAIKAIITKEEKDYDFNDFITNYVKDEDLKECETIEDIRKLLEKANEDYEITETEVIYFNNAIEYLQENDPSLCESLEIANEYGYTTDKLNSEILASLLLSRNNQEDYWKFIDYVCSEIEQQSLLD